MAKNEESVREGERKKERRKPEKLIRTTQGVIAHQSEEIATTFFAVLHCEDDCGDLASSE